MSARHQAGLEEKQVPAIRFVAPSGDSILEARNETYSDQEKATKLTEGLISQLLKEVGYMDPTTPTKFLNKASKALELNCLANQPIRQNWQMTWPYDVQNPLKFVTQQTHYYQTPRYRTSPPIHQYAKSFGDTR